MEAMFFDEREADAEIVSQNDAFRKGEDRDKIKGQLVLTSTIVAEGRDFIEACIKAVQEFDSFTEDMDPHGDHAMGAMQVEGKTIWFKIDLYDEAYMYGTPDPLDLSQTRRVLTILFPSDY